VCRSIGCAPFACRVPLTLFHLDGLSHDRVAGALDVPVGTARSLVTRARARLRMLLTPSLAMSDDVFDERATPRMLHILNGDAVAGTIREAGVPGTLAVWADVLHEGPVSSCEVEPERARAIRARFLDAVGYVPYADALRIGAEWDAPIERFAEHDEVVIWVEHDLFDQLLLIRHLAWFAERSLGATRLSLICIGDYPGFQHFKGLGELAPDQLASLLGTRERVTLRQTEIGRRAWRAFATGDPSVLEHFVDEEDLTALPFLEGALRRHLEELPSVVNGLSRTEQGILAILAGGPTSLGDLARRLQATETQYFVTDTTLRRLLDNFAADPALVTWTEAPNFWSSRATITDAGRAMLAGTVDRLAQLGRRALWRWNASTRRVQRDSPEV
jgi:hypothetical protein